MKLLSFFCSSFHSVVLPQRLKPSSALTLYNQFIPLRANCCRSNDRTQWEIHSVTVTYWMGAKTNWNRCDNERVFICQKEDANKQTNKKIKYVTINNDNNNEMKSDFILQPFEYKLFMVYVERGEQREFMSTIFIWISKCFFFVLNSCGSCSEFYAIFHSWYTMKNLQMDFHPRKEATKTHTEKGNNKQITHNNHYYFKCNSLSTKTEKKKKWNGFRSSPLYVHTHVCVCSFNGIVAYPSLTYYYFKVNYS